MRNSKIAQEYDSDETLFLEEFAAAWTKVMNLDQFGGVCESYSFCPKDLSEVKPCQASLIPGWETPWEWLVYRICQKIGGAIKWQHKKVA